MAFRRFILTSAVAATLALPFATPVVRAQGSASSDAETSRHNFIGVVNASNTFVRSSPREDAYPTMKLDHGARVTVLDIKGKWLKILPPEGSFAYIGKAFVNKRGDGKMGRASRESIARVGSTLNPRKDATMARIDDGQDVEIIGEQDDYWTIKPPEGSCLWINEAYVDPLQAIPETHETLSAKANKQGGDAARETVIADSKPLDWATPAPLKTQTPTADSAMPADAATTPAATAPTLADRAQTQAAFDKLEADFKSANAQAITDQPLDTLLAGYQDLAAKSSLTTNQKKICDIRVSTLQLRSESKKEYLASLESERLAADRQKAMTAERDEIAARIKEQELLRYAAVGTLRASSIQRPHGTLYRLTDPATGRTVAYVRTGDTRYASLIGQFVGVKGSINVDPALSMKIIDPTDASAIDPSKVNGQISALIIPPSMIPGATASSTPND